MGRRLGTWSAIDLMMTRMGTARMVPHTPQIHERTRRPRNTVPGGTPTDARITTTGRHIERAGRSA